MVFESLCDYLITICLDFGYVPIVRIAVTTTIPIHAKIALEATLRRKVEFSEDVMQVTHRSKHKNQQVLFMHTHSFLSSACINTHHWSKYSRICVTSLKLLRNTCATKNMSVVRCLQMITKSRRGMQVVAEL